MGTVFDFRYPLTLRIQCKNHGLQAYAYENALGTELNIIYLDQLSKTEILREGERREIEHDTLVTSYFIDHGTTDEFTAAIRTAVDRFNIRDIEKELGLENDMQVADILFASQATRGSSPLQISSPNPSQDRYSPYSPPEDWALIDYGATPKRGSTSHSQRSASPRRRRARVSNTHNRRSHQELEISDVVEELCKAVQNVGWEFWNGRGIPTLENLLELVASPLTDVGMVEKKPDLLKMLDLQPTPDMRIQRHRDMRGLWARNGRDASTCPNCWRYAQTDCTWNLCSHHCVDIAGLRVSCDEDYHVAREVDAGGFIRNQYLIRYLMVS